MDRRDFLLLRVTNRRETELSCERLYMRHVDARAAGTTGELMAMLEADLAKTRSVRVLHPEWLVDGEMKRSVQRILSKFESDGGTVRYM